MFRNFAARGIIFGALLGVHLLAAEPKAGVPQGSKRVHLLLSGVVQGVGFRDFTRRTAQELKITGWVRNLPTGEVELEAQGTEDAMKKFDERIKQGPPGSKVDKIVAKNLNKDLLPEFEIRETPAR